MSESLDRFRAEAAELVGELRCWLERLARSNTVRQQRYDCFGARVNGGAPLVVGHRGLLC